MEVLPDLALRNLVRFLYPKDVVRLGRTCKRMYSVMPRVVLAKEKWLGEDFHIHEYYGERVSSEPYFDTPAFSSTVKSLCLSVTWRDQGSQGGYSGINVTGGGGGGIRRIFLGQKFSTPVFFWVEDLTVYFFGSEKSACIFWVRISARLIVLTQFKPKFPQDPKV